MTPKEQLERWVSGHPECPNDRGECCPDFSCCRPDLLRPVHERRAYAAATPEQREGMLIGYLCNMLSTEPYPPEALPPAGGGQEQVH